MKNNKLKGLYVITDDKLTPPEILKKSVIKAINGGAKIVQLRDKISDDDTIEKTSLMLQGLCREFGVLFILNDRVDLAKKLNLDGVHIGNEDYDNFSKIREYFDGIIGVSCYGDLHLAKNMQELGADYVAFGACFSSTTKPNAQTIDLNIITKAKKELTIPVCVIGGINITNLDLVIAHKPDMICVISDIWSSDDITTHTKIYTDAFKS